MHRLRIAATCMLLALPLVLSAEAPAGRNAAASLQWHSIREYANVRDSVDRKIYIHFWAKWCGNCRKMEKFTFADPAVAELLQESFFLIKVDTDREQRVADAFRVRGLPANLFLTQDGSEIARREGYIPPRTFVQVLEAIVGTN